MDKANFPTLELSETERLLTAEEIGSLCFASQCRAIAAGTEGLVEGSEVASYHPDFGHVFRYDIENLIHYEEYSHALFGHPAYSENYVEKLILVTNNSSDLRGYIFSNMKPEERRLMAGYTTFVANPRGTD